MADLSAEGNIDVGRRPVGDLGRLHGVPVQVLRSATPWLDGPDTVVVSAGPIGGFGELGYALQRAYRDVRWAQLDLTTLVREPIAVDLPPLAAGPRTAARRAVLVSVHEGQDSSLDGPPTLDGVRRATGTGLALAVRCGGRRVALPLLGAGVLGMPAADVAVSILRAIDTVLRSSTERPDAIMLVCRTPADEAAVVDAWDDHQLLREAKLRAMNDTTLREQAAAGGADRGDLAVALDLPDDELWRPCEAERVRMRARPDPEPARLRLRQTLVDEVMMPRLRLAVANRREERARANRELQRSEIRRPLTDVDSRGLRRLPSDGTVVGTAARRELHDLLDPDRSARASIGVAGARGCGKSTLLGDAYARWGTRGVRILLPAPAGYAPREFLLHLYGRVCAEVMSRDADDPAAGRAGTADTAARRSRNLLALIVAPLVGTLLGATVAVTAALRAPAAGPAGIGLTVTATACVPLLLVWALRSWFRRDAYLWRPPGPGRWLATAGLCGLVTALAPPGSLTPRQLGGVTLLIVAAGGSVWPSRLGARWPGETRPDRREPLSSRSSAAARRTVAVIAVAAVDVSAAVLGALLLALPATVPLPPVPVLVGALVTAVAGSALWAGTDRYRQLRSHRPSGPPGDEASRAAARALARIHYQTTVVSGWSGALKAAPSWLPIGADLGVSGSTSEAALPLGVPDLVDGIKRLLPSRGPALVAIDELDKIESVERARDFLNEIKGILDADRCFFLISMSEDAIGSFERRGLPFRDVFDSAFDEVVRAPHLSAAESFDLIGSRITGAPVPYAALAYCQSGGLPRDLLRATARMLALAEDDRARLATVAHRVVHRDLLGKTEAVTAAITTIMLEPAVSAVLRMFRDLDTCGHGEPSACLLDEGWLARAEALPVMAGEPADDVIRGRELLRLTVELLGYAYYCRTLLELFRAGSDEETDALIRLVHGDGGRLLDRLAQVRQTFLVNPFLAWELLSETRAYASLTAFALPAPLGNRRYPGR
ncbi:MULTISPECIES: hypothetical protein [Catenuloplanes]|uniref:KAP NTPase domain-containing protein n=1 Tax=Catenuloplanes niger TaxID=587534 RepID=A0AAE4CXA7_9ACTN|nr:hypothetical protein [Catenuloplanes niger]MDR7327282.1 hypothetical protein [Catenuloplanes niger]